jgi:hypothetical protein
VGIVVDAGVGNPVAEHTEVFPGVGRNVSDAGIFSSGSFFSSCALLLRRKRKETGDRPRGTLLPLPPLKNRIGDGIRW